MTKCPKCGSNALRAWCVTFALAGLSGCANNPDAFRLDGSVSAEHRALWACALDAWCEASAGRLCGSLSASGDSLGLDTDTIYEDADGVVLGQHTARAAGASRVEMVRGVKADVYYTVLAHEIGHHWGAHDQPGGFEGLMVWADAATRRACDPDVVTAADVALARAE